MKTKRIWAWLLTLTMLMTFMPSFGIAAAVEDEPTVTQSDTKENTNQAGGIIYTKTSTAKSDGTIDITLTAHTTGVVRQVTSVSPTDIVLVLDVSGSMENAYDSFSVTTYGEVLGERYTYYTGIFNQRTGYGFNNRSNYYINTGTAESPVYTRVSRTGRDSNGYEYFEYSRGYTEVYVYPELENGTPTNRSNNYAVYQFYSARTTNTTTSRMDVLKNAVNSFIDTTATMNEGLETDEMHTISIVKFAGPHYSNGTTDTPVITPGNGTYILRNGNNSDTSNYSQVVAGLTPVNGEGAAALKTAVASLTPAGSTAVDKGLALAEAVLMNRSAVVPEGAVDRNEVVIVFTDGEPNYWNGFDSDVADDAIEIAGKMESTAGVTVYGVSVAPDADATDLDEKINKFMHYVSSNYPTATSMESDEEDCDTSAGYYMTPDDSMTLTMIFESIIQNIDHPTITMGEEATMVDTISPYFDFENGSATNVILQTSARNADGTWADPVDDENLEANITNDRLTVDGFDFDANYVSDTGRGDSGDFYGQRLVVSFTVVPDYDVIDVASATLMDGILPTNSGFASLVDSDSAPAAEVETPELSAHQVTYMVDGAEYTSYNRFTGSDVEVDAVPTKEGYTFSGWTLDGAPVAPGHEFVMPDEDVEIRGTFTANEYNVKYLLDGTNPGATLPEDKKYSCDETVAVEADLAVPGYTFSGWYTEDAAVTAGEFIMPAHEVVFYGSFEPADDITYEVEYYFENLDGETDPSDINDYTENASVGYVDEGIAGTIARAELKTFDGFTLNRDISEISGTVTIDEHGVGNLVLKLYYQRNRHDVTYSYVGDFAPEDTVPSAADLPSANLTDVKYGSSITVIGAPDIPDDSSYEFVGWSADNLTGISAGQSFAMPDADVHIKGSFHAANDAEYKVEHYLENANGDFVHHAESDVTLYIAPGETAYIRLANAFTFEGHKLADKAVFIEKYPAQTYNETEYRLEQIIADGLPVEVFKLYYVRDEYEVSYEFVNSPVANMPTLPTSADYPFGATVEVDKTEINIPGYTFSGWDTEDATIVNGKFTMPAKDVVLRGRFSPAPVEWKEQHYLQNAENPAQYDLDDTPTGNITHHNMTGDDVTVNAGHYPGFALNEEKTNTENNESGLPQLDDDNAVTAEVLNDGSLVVKFYYDRNVHSVTYQYEGMAPAVAPQAPDPTDNVPYGKEVTVANSPSVPGYTFSGWTTTDATVNEGKFDMPDKDVVFKGSFASNEVEYTVNYYLQNIEDDNYTLDSSYTEDAFVGQHVEAVGKAYTGFSLNTAESTTFGHVTVNEAGTGNLVLNLYYDRHTYNVTYDYYGEQPANAPDLSSKNRTNVRFGTVLDVESKPALNEYSFDGWYTRTATVSGNEFTMPDHDVAFLGRFVAQYTVSYDLNGGTGADGVSYADETVTAGTVVELKAAPTRADYVFMGWSDTTNTYQPEDDFTVNADVTFTAQWEEDVVGPDPDDGDGVPDIYQKKITFKIENGTWDGVSAADKVHVVDLKDEHGEYSKNGTADISGIIPTGMLANAGFKNGAWLVVPPTEVSGTEEVTYTYTFDRSTTPVDPSDKVYYVVEHYKVNADGTYPEYPTESERKLGTIGEKATATPKVYEGYALDETISIMEADLVEIESADDIVTLKLYYDIDEIGETDPHGGDDIPDKYQVTITYASNNEEYGTVDKTIEVKTLPDNATTGNVEVEATATKIGSRTYFSDWKLDGVQFSTEAALNGVIEGAEGGKVYSLVANFGRNSGGGGGGVTRYTLTYETNGGKAIAKETYASGTTVKLTKVPVKDGYVFEGWHLDEALTEDVSEVKMTKNITVYAAWVEDNGNAGNGHETPGALNGKDHFAYVIGYPDGTVRPNDNISRAEVTAIFFRLLKPDEVRDGNLTSNNSFDDVNSSAWHNTAISTMAKLGIVNGRTAGSFVPDAFITRAEFAVICARFDNSEFEVVDNFADVKGHWAEDEIHEAAAHGWIRGYEDNTFKPDQFITRAEAMTMINRVLNRIPETTADLLENMIKWPDNSDQSAWYYLPVQEATNSHEYDMKNHIYEKWTALREGTDWTKYEK